MGAWGWVGGKWCSSAGTLFSICNMESRKLRAYNDMFFRIGVMLRYVYRSDFGLQDMRWNTGLIDDSRSNYRLFICSTNLLLLVI